MEFHNSTTLDDDLLYRAVLRHTVPYRHDRLQVRFRYSRGSDFSGRCFYREGRIFVNLGKRLRYPYTLGTHIAKAESTSTGWRRDIFRLTVGSELQLALFVYLHELYHYLVERAGRSPRRKEAMCDRFATRVMVDCYGCPLRDSSGSLAQRSRWDFKDLHAFVAAAPKDPQLTLPFVSAIPVRIRGMGDASESVARGPWVAGAKA